MTSYVTDTHALYWYLTASTKLGTAAKEALDEAAAGDAVVIVPTIVLAGLYFLNEKAGRPIEFAEEIERLASAGQFRFVPLEATDVADFEADKDVSEMHDRIIVGVARRAQAKLLSRDAAIAASGAIAILW